jgi:hypothetical protein
MVVHISHIEEILFNQGTQGVYHILNNITSVTLKLDDSPSIVVGSDSYGPFVSTKSFFNKSPKYYYTDTQIDNNISDPNLAQKLKWVLQYHPELFREKGKLNQGGILWYPGSYQDVNGYRHFRPNIIEYRVPLEYIHDSQKIGVMWHTDLTGNGLFQSTKDIWTPMIKVKLSHCGYDISTNFDSLITPIFSLVFNTFVKDQYKLGVTQPYDNLYTDFEEWFEEFAIKYVSQWKSKSKIDEAADSVSKFKAHFTKDHMRWVYNQLKLVHNLKNRILFELYHQVNHIQTYIQIDGQDLVTNHEGFVIVSPHGTFKVVDRAEFTKLNQATNVTRGWELS